MYWMSRNALRECVQRGYPVAGMKEVAAICSLYSGEHSDLADIQKRAEDFVETYKNRDVNAEEKEVEKDIANALMQDFYDLDNKYKLGEEAE